jgi:hypothetical protein
MDGVMDGVSSRSPGGGRDLFAPVVAEEKFSPHFRHMLKYRGSAPSRGMMNEVFSSFDDVDGNVVEQFQTTGFDARVWELYLHAYFRDVGFAVMRGRPSPDFVLRRTGHALAVEAVTANPSPLATERLGDLDLVARHEHAVIRLGSALYSKLAKRDWERPDVVGMPFILAVAPFYDPDASQLSSSSLEQYLYGAKHSAVFDPEGRLFLLRTPIESHSAGAKTIPSAFFSQPGVENISAVLFSNAGTEPKFGRMGHQGRHRGDGITMMRGGLRHDNDPNAARPCKFVYTVGDGTHCETWGEGLALLHNPFALHPIGAEVFADIAQIWQPPDGPVRQLLPLFHPYMSQTYVIVATGE